ncbi:MAG: ribonuclease III [Actinomycetes bacterium]
MTYASLTKTLGISIDSALLELALTHSSFAYENGKKPDNERLEFLGDSVLGFIVTGHIYLANPTMDEGSLSRIRNAAVSAKTLAIAATNIGLGEYLSLGKGELASGGRDKPNILADTLEALIGAAYISSGLEAAKTIIDRFVIPLIDSADELLETSEPRTVLQELLKSANRGDAVFEVTHEGPDHDRTFFAAVIVDSETIASGTGRSRKAAEAEAAIAALKALRG